MTSFHQRIHTALLDQNLRIAINANAERRVNGRLAAFESLPDWPLRRKLAHAVKADIVEHLEEYLEQFVQNVQANGITVHRAADAGEAVQIILNIAGEGSALFAKSKSMVSEEIELNHALEAAGHRVVETDLGEYIVQLRGEKPAHIITPAVHLRRNDVGKLFHEKLGIPYSEDIPTLTNTARRVLREVFLGADIGLSGVNFGVISSGGLCTITNEGNGRMVTTLPRTHIALMGLERLVRDFDDLALMMSLLPRCATGQKITVYTQVIHKPLNGQQRHLVLLDNGRMRLRDSELREALYCIRCGACLNSCPVFREIGGHAYQSPYSGPIGSVISASLVGPEYAGLAQASSLCGACKEACPVDIDLPLLITRVRAGQFPVPEAAKKPDPGQGLPVQLKLGLGLYARAASRPRLFALAQKLAAAGTRLLSPFSPMMRLPAFTGWGLSKDFPRFAARSFRERYKSHELQTNQESGDLAAGPNPLPAPHGAGMGDAGWTPARPTGPPSLPRSAALLGPSERKGGEVAGPNPPSPPSLNGKGGAIARPAYKPGLDLAARFSEELVLLGGQVLPSDDPARTVSELLRGRGIDCVHLEPGALEEGVLLAAGIRVVHNPDPGVRAGVTRALCGVADTGSILVTDGEGDPLHASLLPEMHIAILRASDIVPSLADALPQVRGSRSAVFITGPSRTADIEMQITIGVHGPGEMVVVMVGE